MAARGHCMHSLASNARSVPLFLAMGRRGRSLNFPEPHSFLLQMGIKEGPTLRGLLWGLSRLTKYGAWHTESDR